jgi:NADH-quinone oxidoreductase subunit G
VGVQGAVGGQGAAGGFESAEHNRLGALLRTSGAVVLVGERAAQAPGLLTAVAGLVDATGARLAWVPRRAGERGALDAGALGNVLPGGRPLADPTARAEVETAWGVSVPTAPGRDTSGILADVALPMPEDSDDSAEAAESAEPRGLAGLLVGGVQVTDLPDPAAALTAIAGAGFVVSLELRASAVTALADVVFPVAAAVEKSGAYLNWEGRLRPFDAALPDVGTLDEGRILDTLGVEMDVDLYTQTPAAAAGELARLGWWAGARPGSDGGGVGAGVGVGHGDSVGGSADGPVSGPGYRLASWRMNLDGGRAMDGEPHLAGTAKPDAVRLPLGAAAALGVADGDPVAVRGPAGSITLPAAVTPMVDDVVWLPAMIDGLPTGGRLGATVGALVHIDPVLAETGTGGVWS